LLLTFFCKMVVDKNIINATEHLIVLTVNTEKGNLNKQNTKPTYSTFHKIAFGNDDIFIKTHIIL
uniref:hypothetical protein n=1 Tax=Klebsiella pneumoniae TaxID=573 RepID=UPI001CC20D3C